MCLTIPYKIILLKSKKALVDYFGKRKEVNLGLMIIFHFTGIKFAKF